MTVTATLQGRNLALHIAGIEEPFIIKPLGGRQGQELTQTFLNICAGLVPQAAMDGVLAAAADGIDADGNWITDGPNNTRAYDELQLSEVESILLPAFYWQTVLGFDGINAYISGGEGMAGAKKALELLILSLGISPTLTGPSGALGNLMQQLAPTPPTSPSTTTLDKLPPNKQSRKPAQKKNRKA